MLQGCSRHAKAPLSAAGAGQHCRTCLSLCSGCQHAVLEKGELTALCSLQRPCCRGVHAC